MKEYRWTTCPMGGSGNYTDCAHKTENRQTKHKFACIGGTDRKTMREKGEGKKTQTDREGKSDRKRKTETERDRHINTQSTTTEVIVEAQRKSLSHRLVS